MDNSVRAIHIVDGGGKNGSVAIDGYDKGPCVFCIVSARFGIEGYFESTALFYKCICNNGRLRLGDVGLRYGGKLTDTAQKFLLVIVTDKVIEGGFEGFG